MNAIEQARKAIESQYRGKCTVVEYQSYKKENKSSGFHEVTVIENQPCKLSFSTVNTANSSNTATSLTQLVKVFISPDVTIKPGSKLVIMQDNKTAEYENSGEPAVYQTHQEIALKLFNGWT